MISLSLLNALLLRLAFSRCSLLLLNCLLRASRSKEVCRLVSSTKPTELVSESQSYNTRSTDMIDCLYTTYPAFSSSPQCRTQTWSRCFGVSSREFQGGPMDLS
ncbi:hypothetical protein R3P38DRAFT_3068220, partial [Favolaschia claudopus]